MATSIVDYLKSKGQGASFKDRQALYESKYGSKYQGTAEQNTQLLQDADQPEQLDSLGGGKSCKPGTPCDSIKGLSPFKLHPANMALKKMGASHDYLPPPMNAAVSAAGALVDKLKRSAKSNGESMAKRFSPFGLHPANMVLGKLGATHSEMPPPINVALSVAEKIGKPSNKAESKKANEEWVRDYSIEASRARNKATGNPYLQLADGGRADYSPGGPVSGPGTETSDSIPARLSDGEFVNNAASTAMSRDEVHPIVAEWVKSGGDAEDLLEAINDAGLEKRYGSDDAAQMSVSFLKDSRDFVDTLAQLPHNEESLPVLKEYYEKLSRSKPTNPNDAELDAIADVKVALAAWMAQQPVEANRSVGGFMSGLASGFETGQNISSRYRTAKQRQAYENELQDGISKTEAELAEQANKSTATAINSGAVNTDNLGEGGGENIYSNASDAQDAFKHAQDYESMKSDPVAKNPDAAFSSAFKTMTEPKKEDLLTTFPLPQSTIETKPLGTSEGPSIEAQSKAALDQSEAVAAANDEQIKPEVPAQPSMAAQLSEHADGLDAAMKEVNEAAGRTGNQPVAQPATQPIAQPVAQATTAQADSPRAISMKQVQSTNQRTFNDIYSDKYVPRMQQLLMKQGKFKEAEAWGEWAEQQDNKARGKAWTDAMGRYMSGDKRGAMEAAQNIYNKMVPDGKYAETIPGEGDKFRVNIRDEKTHQVLNSFDSDIDELPKLALNTLSPTEQFNAFWKMQEAEREAQKPNYKVVGDVLVDVKTGKAVFDARKDKEATGYVAELEMAVTSGKMTQKQADGLYIEFLTNKAKKSEGTTIHNWAPQSSMITNPDGTVTASQVGKDRQPSNVPTGQVDAKYIDGKVSEATQIVDKTWENIRPKDPLFTYQTDVRANVERIMRAKPDSNISAVVKTVMDHYRGYAQYVEQFKLAETDEQRKILSDQARASGILPKK
jgi:hypothetical protein